jgi:hypothetical protein
MTFGFPAYFEATEHYDCERGELLDAVERALDALGWKFDYTGPASLNVSVSVNFWSWGEQMTVHARKDGTLEVRSQCRLPTQCIDWGKNRRNVNTFLERLDRVLARRARARERAESQDAPEPNAMPPREERIRRVSDNPPDDSIRS